MLEDIFNCSKYASQRERIRFAEQLNADESRVENWFKKRTL